MYDVESRFTVKQLKNICAALGASQSGTKPILQRRIRVSLETALRMRDTASFNIAKNSVVLERGRPYNATYSTNRYVSNIDKGFMEFRPANGYTASGSSATSSHQTSTWGLPSVYQNVRQRMVFFSR